MPRRILFCLRHAGYYGLFESALTLAAERGNDLMIVLESDKYVSGRLLELAARHPNVSLEVAPASPAGSWTRTSRAVRGVLDYLRYLEPSYETAPKLRERAAQPVPRFARRALETGKLSDPRARHVLRRALRGLDRLAPTSRPIREFVRERRPDLVTVTPLFGLASSQIDLLRAARELGISSALCVASWDNLTNKGLVHEVPDLVTVWNDAQRREAVELHGVPAERVKVTGAQNFDKWFGRAPATSREELGRRTALRPDRPIVLYLCSSGFIAPREKDHVRRWIDGLRATDGPLAEAGLLVRPHPQNVAQWLDVDLSAEEQVALWPDPREAPAATGKADWAQSDFFDSMYHAAAVVGVNTSAMIESAILGRDVFTLLAPEFAETQGGTLHFDYLLAENGGMLHVASTLGEHVAQLEAALAGDEAGSDRNRRFVEWFVRPHGLDRPATPVLVETLEAEAAKPAPAPVPESGRALAARRLLFPVALVIGLRPTLVRRRVQRALHRAGPRAVHLAAVAAGPHVRRVLDLPPVRDRLLPRASRALRLTPAQVEALERVGRGPRDGEASNGASAGAQSAATRGS